MLYWEGKKRGHTMRTTTHDSFLFEIPITDVEQAVAWMKPIMERKFSELAGFSCPADFSVGVSWGKGLRDLMKHDDYIEGMDVKLGRLQSMRKNAMAT